MQFAGMVGLANDARISIGKSPLGFINPLLYSSAFSGVFNDVTSGSNVRDVNYYVKVYLFISLLCMMWFRRVRCMEEAVAVRASVPLLAGMLSLGWVPSTLRSFSLQPSPLRLQPGLR